MISSLSLFSEIESSVMWTFRPLIVMVIRLGDVFVVHLRELLEKEKKRLLWSISLLMRMTLYGRGGKERNLEVGKSSRGGVKISSHTPLLY